MSTAFDRLTARLADVTGHVPRGYGDRAMARCPGHQDGSPSLSLRRANDRVLVHCHAGCDLSDVLGALDLGMGDLFDAPRERGWQRPYMPPQPREPAAPLGIEYTTEVPDVPGITKLAMYAAATAHVERGGDFLGGPTVRLDPYLTTFDHRSESQTGRAFWYRPRPGRPIRWAEWRAILRCERCGTPGADCSWRHDMTREGGGDCCARCRHPNCLVLVTPTEWEA